MKKHDLSVFEIEKGGLPLKLQRGDFCFATDMAATVAVGGSGQRRGRGS